GHSSFSTAEAAWYCFHIDQVLSDEPRLATRLPLSHNVLGLFDSCRDGVILCHLAKLIQDSVIPSSSIAYALPLNIYQMTGNCNTAIVAATKLGCRVVNMGGQDLTQGKPTLILSLLWQLIRLHLLAQVSASRHPDFMAESNLPPEEVLLRWFNHQLEWSFSPRRVANLGEDIRDGKAYLDVMRVLNPSWEGFASVKSEDPPAVLAAAVVGAAEDLGIQVLLRPCDILSGMQLPNLGFVASLFNLGGGISITAINSVALKLQAQFRGRKYRFRWKEMRRSAVKMQARARGVLQRLHIKDAMVKHRASRIAAATNISSAWRMYLVRREFVQLRQAVVIAQSHRRRLLAEREKGLRVAAVKVLQRSGAIFAFKSKRHNAAMTAQRNLRIGLGRRRREKMWASQIAAACVMQRLARKFVWKHRRAAMHMERKIAATTLARLYRGRLCRALMQKKQESACEIQRVVRGHQDRKRVAVRLVAVCTLQRAAVLFLWRVRRHHAATVLQSNVRGRQGRQLLARKHCSAVKMQALVRGVMQRLHIKDAMAKHRASRIAAATSISSAWRMYLVRREFVRLRQAVVIAQSHRRRLLAQREKGLRVAAVKVLQRSGAIFAFKSKRHSAAVTAQRNLRIGLGRRRREKMWASQIAATCAMQRLARKFVWKHRRAAMHKERHNAAMTAQRNLRIGLGRRRREKMWASQIAAACVMQRLARKFVWRHRRAAMHMERKIAATTLARLYRGHRCRALMQKKQESACEIQRVVRGHQDRKRVAVRLVAVGTLHRSVALFLWRRRMAKRVSAGRIIHKALLQHRV
ncbi:unnamed protein product, partial [Chrysoparadoxa australica]